MTKRLTVYALAAGVAAAGCAPLEEAMQGHQNAVARVDGYTLTVNHAAEILGAAESSGIPATTTTVDRLTDLWIGYTILADQMARPEPFSEMDLTPLMGTQMDQEVLWDLRQGEIVSRAEPEGAALDETYRSTEPYVEVKLQHILVRVPTDATEAQDDSLEQLAERIRDAAASGQDFGELARRYSQDPGSAALGGDLGWVGRNRLLPELDRVVLTMQPGEVSETVRSDLGYHIFKATDRRSPDFEAVRDQFAEEYMQRELSDIEAAYVDSLFQAADPRIARGATSLTRRLASMTGLERLSSVQRSAVLIRYRGGELTVGEWADFVIYNTPDMRRAFASADSAQARELLQQLMRNELLVKAARDGGYHLPAEEADSLRTVGRNRLMTLAGVNGIRREELVSADREPRMEVVQRVVDRVLRDVFARQRSPQPLDRAGPALRRGRTIQIYVDRFPEVVERIEEQRSPTVEGR